MEELWFEAETLTEAIELGKSMALQEDAALMVTYRSGRRIEIKNSPLNTESNSEEHRSGTLSQIFDQTNESQHYVTNFEPVLLNIFFPVPHNYGEGSLLCLNPSKNLHTEKDRRRIQK